MGKFRIGLLATLLVLPALIAALSQSASAATIRSGATHFASQSSSSGNTAQGEPDSGQTGKDPTKTQTSSSSSSSSTPVSFEFVRQIRLLRWTSGIWMRRSLGIGI